MDCPEATLLLLLHFASILHVDNNYFRYHAHYGRVWLCYIVGLHMPVTRKMMLYV